MNRKATHLLGELGGKKQSFQQTLPESRVRQGHSVYNQSKEFDMKINKIIFSLGLLIALTAATLLFFGVIESGIAALIGIVGIGLISASGAGFAASHDKGGKL